MFHGVLPADGGSNPVWNQKFAFSISTEKEIIVTVSEQRHGALCPEYDGCLATTMQHIMITFPLLP